jgi:hypothetical protein
LQHLRGTGDVADELNTLRTDLAREGRQLAGASELLSPRLRRPLIIGIGLAMFQQITGSNTVIYFARPSSNPPACPPRQPQFWPQPALARSMSS